MTDHTLAGSTRRSGGADATRNFILQQGLCEPATGAGPGQYSALLFQPRLVGLLLAAAIVLQAPLPFLAVGAVLWWSALAAAFNPFDALYNATLARRNGTVLKPAPAPRRFAQFMAGSFALAIGVSLATGWRTTAFVLEGFLVIALAALVLGRFCLGSFIFHLLAGRADFARRTLPWAAGV
jgi:hypothetical protein